MEVDVLLKIIQREVSAAAADDSDQCPEPPGGALLAA